MKLSKHSIARMKERTSFNLCNPQEQRKLFRAALNHGISPGNIKDGKLKKYLLSKSKKCKLKIYKGYVFIYSKNAKQLYTLYKIPDALNENEECYA